MGRAEYAPRRSNSWSVTSRRPSAAATAPAGESGALPGMPVAPAGRATAAPPSAVVGLSERFAIIAATADRLSAATMAVAAGVFQCFATETILTDASKSSPDGCPATTSCRSSMT